jgi:hypothetical protein
MKLVWPNDWPNVSSSPLVGLRTNGPFNAESPCGARALGTWARRVSNLRPLACEASALPLSYAPSWGGSLAGGDLEGGAVVVPAFRVVCDVTDTK